MSVSTKPADLDWWKYEADFTEKVQEGVAGNVSLFCDGDEVERLESKIGSLG